MPYEYPLYETARGGACPSRWSVP